MRQTITTTCPTTGEQASLAQIANRHGLTRGLVHWRYHSGKRGAELAAPSRNWEQTKPLPADARELIERAKRSPLAQPMRHLARASKEAISHA